MYGYYNALKSTNAVVGPPPVVPPVNQVLPVITGTLFTNQVLSCSTGTWTNSPTSYTYQWKRNTVNIGSATNDTYTTVDADAGTTITCLVTAINTAGNTPATTAGVAVSGGPSNTVAPVVSGTTTVGQVLSTTNGTWLGNTGNVYTYQWKRTGVNIGSATSSTYTLVAADIDATITCAVTATNSAGNATATSNTTAVVVSIPINTVAPVVSGTATVGQTLSSTTGTWVGTATISYTYQWKRGGVDISLATAANYTLVPADFGSVMTCAVTGTNSVGNATATSNATSAVIQAPINTVAPAVTGTATVGQVLSCSTGTWTGTATITFTYQWKRDGSNIGSATASTYTLVTADTGAAITCTVTGTNSVGNSSATSNATATVVAAPVNTVAPAITGTTTVGQVLSCSTGTWTGTATINFTYQWRRGGVDIGSATSSTYTLIQPDTGAIISCAVLGTNSVGNATAVSNNTAAIASDPLVRTRLAQTAATTTSLNLAVTPTPYALLTAWIGVRKNGAATNAITFVDDGGNTWTETVTQTPFFATNGTRLAQFKCRMGASPGTITTTAASSAATSIAIHIDQFVGASDVLTNVAPMATSNIADMTNVLPTAPVATNIVIGAHICTGAATTTDPAGHTLINATSGAGTTFHTTFANITNTNQAWVSTGGDGVAGAIEIKQA